MKTLVILLGPPAVGKLAVGRALEQRTGLPLFHNHMSIELVLPFFEFGSGPFSRLVGRFRRQLFEEVASGEGPGLIFTYVWDFDGEGDQRFIEETVGIFGGHGARTVFVELWADLRTRLVRNRTELRLREKPSKRDVEASEARLRQAEKRHRMSSSGSFPFPDHLKIDNTHLSPDEVAETVVSRFSLPSLRGESAEEAGARMRARFDATGGSSMSRTRSPDSEPDDAAAPLRLVVLLFVEDGQLAAFDDYEARAERIMARYGGVIEQRVRLESAGDGSEPDEVHLVSFPDEASVAAYRTDRDTMALAELRSRVIRETVVWRESGRPPDAVAEAPGNRTP